MQSTQNKKEVNRRAIFGRFFSHLYERLSADLAFDIVPEEKQLNDTRKELARMLNRLGLKQGVIA